MTVPSHSWAAPPTSAYAISRGRRSTIRQSSARFHPLAVTDGASCCGAFSMMISSYTIFLSAVSSSTQSTSAYSSWRMSSPGEVSWGRSGRWDRRDAGRPRCGPDRPTHRHRKGGGIGLNDNYQNIGGKRL